MHKYALITAYKAMLYTAREEGFQVDEKYEELENELPEMEVTDMIDNLETFYQALKEIV